MWRGWTKTNDRKEQQNGRQGVGDERERPKVCLKDDMDVYFREI